MTTIDQGPKMGDQLTSSPSPTPRNEPLSQISLGPTTSPAFSVAERTPLSRTDVQARWSAREFPDTGARMSMVIK